MVLLIDSSLMKSGVEDAYWISCSAVIATKDGEDKSIAEVVIAVVDEFGCSGAAGFTVAEGPGTTGQSEFRYMGKSEPDVGMDGASGDGGVQCRIGRPCHL
jgi:hypothetical protein